MFRTVFPSIIRSSRLYYSNRYMSNRYCCLLASKQATVSVWHIPAAVCTVLNSWWWTEKPSETCSVISNKSPTRCNNFLVYYPDVYLRLYLFRGRAGPTTNTARLSPRYEGKTRGCHCSHWAPDDGRENTRNILSCKQTSG